MIELDTLQDSFELPITIELRSSAPVVDKGDFKRWPVIVTGRQSVPWERDDDTELPPPSRLEEDLVFDDSDFYNQLLTQKPTVGDRYALLRMLKGDQPVWFAIKTYEPVAELSEQVKVLRREMEDKYAERMASLEDRIEAEFKLLTEMADELNALRRALLGRQQSADESKDVAELRNKIRAGFTQTNLEGNAQYKVIERIVGRRATLDGVDEVAQLTRLYNAAGAVYKGKITWDDVLDGSYQRRLAAAKDKPAATV